MDLEIVPMEEKFFDGALKVANTLIGDNFLDYAQLEDLCRRGFSKGLNPCFVLLDQERVVGVRITLAPGNWDINDRYSPEKWKVPQDEVCYFKLGAIYSKSFFFCLCP